MDTKYRVRNFWNYFNGVEQEIRTAFLQEDESLLEDLLREVNMQAQSVCDIRVEWEMHDGFYEISFHGGANKTKQYICSLLKKDAPKELVDNWIINAYRQPISQTALHAQVRIDDHIYRGSDFIVYYEVDETAKCIHAEIYSDALRSLKQDQRLQVVYAMLELYIGEMELEARIGDVTVLEKPRDDAQHFCLLPNFYEDICDLVVDEEWMEYAEPCAIYSVYKLDQPLHSETLRKDMILIVTTNC